VNVLMWRNDNNNEMKESNINNEMIDNINEIW